jgi:hypothetical protein
VRIWLRPIALVFFATTIVGCGAAPRSADALANELAALDLDAASESAPDLVLAARGALDEARAAESRGDAVAAADFATIARLSASTAIEEAARIRLEHETLETERETLDAEAEVLAMERASTEATAELARLAAARTARELGAAALARAEVDEARPARAAHLSLTEAAEVRAAASAIRGRARLLRAAAVAMGASAPASLEDLLTRSEDASEPLEDIALADRAYEAARTLLGDARRAAPGVDAARIASLVEAAESEGFHAMTMERGTAIELEDAFTGTSTRPTTAGAARLGRLAALVASYPDGAVLVEVDARTTADATRLSPARATSVVSALVSGGVPSSRVSAAPSTGPGGTPSPQARVRVVLVAYASATPPSGGTIGPTPPAEPTEPEPAGEGE